MIYDSMPFGKRNIFIYVKISSYNIMKSLPNKSEEVMRKTLVSKKVCILLHLNGSFLQYIRYIRIVPNKFHSLMSFSS